MTLIVLVGLACVPAVHGISERGQKRNLLNETNLLFATLIFYAGAGACILALASLALRRI